MINHSMYVKDFIIMGQALQNCNLILKAQLFSYCFIQLCANKNIKHIESDYIILRIISLILFFHNGNLRS